MDTAPMETVDMDKDQSDGDQSYDEVNSSPVAEDMGGDEQFGAPTNFESGSFLEFVNSFGDSLPTPPLLSPQPAPASRMLVPPSLGPLPTKLMEPHHQHTSATPSRTPGSLPLTNATPPAPSTSPSTSIRNKTPLGGSIGRLAKIIDFAPKYDFEEGGATIIIVGPDFQSGMEYYCMFDQEEVPCQVIHPGVLRTVAPAHEPQVVTFCITRGNFTLFSEVRHFEYRKSQPDQEVTPGKYLILLIFTFYSRT